jgi:hypothetical protein
MSLKLSKLYGLQGVSSPRPVKIQHKIERLEVQLRDLFGDLFHIFNDKSYLGHPALVVEADYDYKTGETTVVFFPHRLSRDGMKLSGLAVLAVDTALSDFFKELHGIAKDSPESDGVVKSFPDGETTDEIYGDESGYAIISYSLVAANPVDLLKLAYDFMAKHRISSQDTPLAVDTEAMLDLQSAQLALNDEDFGPEVLLRIPFGVYASPEAAVSAGLTDSAEDRFIAHSLQAIESLVTDISLSGTKTRKKDHGDNRPPFLCQFH